MWWKFKRHRLAVISGILSAADLFLDPRSPRFVAPYACTAATSISFSRRPRAFTCSMKGSFVGPFVYGYELPPEHGQSAAGVVRRTKAKIYRLEFFCRGDSTTSGACSRATSIWYVRRKAAPCFCSARTGWAAISSRGSSTAARISLTIGLIGIAISSRSRW